MFKRTTVRNGSDQKQIKAFAASIGKQDFDFVEIDQSFYDGLVVFLPKKDFTQNYIGSIIKGLKLMLNEAAIQGYNTTTYWKIFKTFTEDIDNGYLDEKELQQLKEKDFSKVPY